MKSVLGVANAGENQVGNLKRSRLLAISVFALVLLVYWPAIHFNFLGYDDTVHVSANPYFSPPTWGHVWYFWRFPFNSLPPTDVVHPNGAISPPYEILWGPLSFTVWAALAMLAHIPSAGPVAPPGMVLPPVPWHLSPLPFHLANLLLHGANGAMVFFVLRRLTRNDWGAYIGALFYALHPLMVEPVSWVTGMNTLLSTGLALLATLFYLRSMDSASTGTPTGAPSRGWYLLSCAVFLAAVLAKPSVAVMPAVVLILLWSLGDGKLARRALELWPWFLCAAVDVLVNLRMRGDSVNDPSIVVAAPLRFFLVADSLAFYLAKVIFPWNLAPDYGRKPHWVLGQPATHFTWIVPVAITWILIASWRRAPGVRGPRLFLGGWTLFCLILAQTSGVVPYYFHLTSLVADRYMYLALLGPAMWLAAAIAHWAPEASGGGGSSPSSVLPSRLGPAARNVVVGSLALVMVFAGRTRAQLPVWSSDNALWSATLRVNDESPTAYRILGEGLVGHDQRERAQSLFLKGLGYTPNDWLLLNDAGENAIHLKQYASAETYLRRSIKACDYDAMPYLFLGLMSVQRGDLRTAIGRFGAGLKVDPTNAGLLANFGVTAGRLGSPKLAEFYLLRALRYGFDPAAGHLYLGIARAQMGRMSEAYADWVVSESLNPQFYETHYDLGLFYFKQGQFNQSVGELNRAVLLMPGYAPAYLAVGRAWLKLGNPEEAKSAIKAALRLRPNWPDAQAALKAAG